VSSRCDLKLKSLVILADGYIVNMAIAPAPADRAGMAFPD
jgi:hypothetical protein